MQLYFPFWICIADFGRYSSSQYEAQNRVCTHEGNYVFSKLAFGLMNSPNAFAMVMSDVLCGINWRFALVYVDDILVYSADCDQHLKHLQEFLTVSARQISNSSLQNVASQLDPLGTWDITKYSKRRNFC